MGGLIEGAKRRIWSIARRIGEGRPRPDLRIALVGYRDVGDAYVTAGASVHVRHGRGLPVALVVPRRRRRRRAGARLRRAARRRGGAAVVRAAARSRSSSSSATRRPTSTTRTASTTGGTWPTRGSAASWSTPSSAAATPQTAAVWREIASAGLGHYAQIDSQGGMNAQVTPYDAELARLGAELSGTVVISGDVRAAGGRGPEDGGPRRHARRGGRGGRRLPRAGRPRWPSRTWWTGRWRSSARS